MKLALFGYYGFRNLGDDLMLEGLCGHLAGENSGVRQLTVIAGGKNPYPLLAGPKVSFYESGTFFPGRAGKLPLLLNADAAFWGGGTCLYDGGGLDGMKGIRRKIKAFGLMGRKPFALFGVGIGNVRSEEGKMLLKAILSGSRYISFRDEESLQAARAAAGREFDSCGDPAFLLKEKIREFRESGIKSGPLKIGFCGVHSFMRDAASIQAAAKSLGSLASGLGARILFVPMHQGAKDDSLFHRAIAARLPEGSYEFTGYGSPEEALRIFSGLDFVIGMRLHTVILSDMLHIPSLAIGYAPKTGAYVKKSGVLADMRLKGVGDAFGPEDVEKIMRSFPSERVRLEGFMEEEKQAVLGSMGRMLESLRERKLGRRGKKTSRRIAFIRTTSVAYEPVVWRKAAAASSSGLEPKIICWDRTGFSGKRKNEKDLIPIRTGRTPYGRGVYNAPKRVLFSLMAIAHLIRLRPAVVHACDLDGVLPALAYRLLFARRAKVIYDQLDPVQNFSSPAPKSVRKALDLIDRLSMRLADSIIIAGRGRQCLLPEEFRRKSMVIHNAPEIDFCPLPKKRRDGGAISILYIGGLSKDRGIEMLLECASALGRIKLTIGGQGVLEWLVKMYASEYENINYTGQVEYEKVKELTSDADVLFAVYNPSCEINRLSSPNKFFEAAAFGKPIIVARGTGIDEKVKEHGMGFVIGYSREELKKLLEGIDRDGLARAGRNAALAYDRYNWFIARTGLAEIYGALSGEKQG
ncbi:MAG: polysaccharide pyruvyl transferase family protein [Nitrospiraceae bacterium]|nr:polysaccharide pyruvyl transferase family protein [Nitrospiraceae bacterium]